MLNYKQLQVSNYTERDRYPDVFSKVKELTTKGSYPKVDLNILSFGCSDGSEAFTLASKYFLNAKILGVDVSAEKVEEAKKKHSLGDRIRYEVINQINLEHYAPFDLIFAMSVFCRWPDTQSITDINNIFPFSLFEEQLSLLDKILIPTSGYLILFNPNFHFNDVRFSNKYEVLNFDDINTSQFVHRFNKDGIKTPGQFSDCIFRKK